MSHRLVTRPRFCPTVTWLIIVVVLFATEYAIMLSLPSIVPTRPSPLAEALVDALTITAIIAPIIWWTLVRPLKEVLRQRTRYLSELFTAIEAERRQTAHELHDGIGQQLSLLISGLRSAHESPLTPTPLPLGERGRGEGEQSARCGELQKLAQMALADVKRIALGLRPSLLDDLGLVAAIDKLVRDFSEHTSIDFALQASSLEGVRLPDAVETATFRICQEALANIVRHSEARHATIELTYRPGRLGLNISDDGKGFAVNEERVSSPSPLPLSPWGRGAGVRGGHMGLLGMQERVALLGGEFSLQSSPGQGCRIAITLPTDGTIYE